MISETQIVLPGAGIRPMSADDYAASERRLGERLVLTASCWWRQVRPCFFRPLLPFREYAPETVRTPPSAIFGGVQHVVPAGHPANSVMSFLMFENAGQYSLERAGSKRHARYVRAAAKEFSVRPVNGPAELAKEGHSTYLSFYDRTGYEVLAHRRSPEGFRAWADAVFDCQPVFVLGAFDQNGLAAVSISRPVEDVLVYAAYFARSEALERRVSDLMLHAVRQVAASIPGIQRIFCRTYDGGGGRDVFYLQRGAILVTKPARLNLNPATSVLLRSFFPGVFRKMRGDVAIQTPVTEPPTRENETVGVVDKA